MAGNEDRGIPLGDGMYIDTARPTIGQYSLSEESSVSQECPCDISEIVSFCGSQATAELCMRNAMSGGGAQEAIIEVVVNCKGPKRRLLGGKKCGAKVLTRAVVLAEETIEDQAEQQQVEVPEIMSGVSLSTLIEDCIEDPDRSMEHEGLLWSDKALDLSGVSPSTHIAVGSRDGAVVHIDVNQSSNPFTPARIQCDLSGKNGELKVEHNDVADEGGQVEYFALDDRAKLDVRVTELFKQYFVRD